MYFTFRIRFELQIRERSHHLFSSVYSSSSSSSFLSGLKPLSWTLSDRIRGTISSSLVVWTEENPSRFVGTAAVVDRIPENADIYLTIDIDGFDPSIAPGTGTPSHGGFLYYEVLEIIAAVAKRQRIVGIDLVEVAPDYDQTDCTAILAAQLLLNVIGRVLHHQVWCN